MWNLKTSVYDRIEFCRMAFEYGRESAQVLNDEDLKNVDANQVAEEVFSGDIQEGILIVDDEIEAHERFVAIFVKGYDDEKERRGVA